jgi:hypothetical protein
MGLRVAKEKLGELELKQEARAIHADWIGIPDGSPTSDGQALTTLRGEKLMSTIDVMDGMEATRKNTPIF